MHAGTLHWNATGGHPHLLYEARGGQPAPDVGRAGYYMPTEDDEGDDEEDGYWRTQQGSEDGSDDEDYSPQVRSPPPPPLRSHRLVKHALSTAEYVLTSRLRDWKVVHSSVHSFHAERNPCTFKHTAIKILLQATSGGVPLC